MSGSGLAGLGTIPLRLTEKHHLLPLSHQSHQPSLSTGLSFFDSSDVLRAGELVEVFGEPGSGKTSFCLSVIARTVVLQKRDAVCIDTHGGVYVHRLREISERLIRGVVGKVEDADVEDDVNRALSRVWIWRIGSMEEVVGTLRVIDGEWMVDKDVGFLCIDNIGWVGRLCMDKNRGKWLLLVVRILKSLAGKYRMSVVLVNQTLSRYPFGRVEGDPVAVPALGDSWAHNCSTRIQLARSLSGNYFIASLIKSRSFPKNRCNFRITEWGIDEAPTEFNGDAVLRRDTVNVSGVT